MRNTQKGRLGSSDEGFAAKGKTLAWSSVPEWPLSAVTEGAKEAGLRVRSGLGVTPP